MNKIKQYYDKVILAVLLLIFILSLVFLLLHIKDAARPVTHDERNAIETLSADYVALETDTGMLKIIDNLPFASRWKAAQSREGSEVFTDFLTTPEIARCAKCYALIYFNDYELKRCSLCKAPLNKEAIIERDRDTDGDGIPDEVESLIGSDPKVFDSDRDSDGDTFANLEEYELCKDSGDYSSITDPKKHPSLTCYLSVVKFEPIPLGFKLTSISANNSDDPAKWRLFIMVNKSNKIYRVGDTFECDGVKYNIMGARRDIPVNAKTGAKPIDRIRIQFVGRSDKIVVEREQKIFDPRPRIVFNYNADGTDHEIQTTIGGKFTIGNDRIDFENVEVLSVTDNDCTVRSSVLSGKIIIGKSAARAPFGTKKSEEAAAVPGGMPASASSINEILQ